MQNWWTIRELATMRQAEILREAEIYRMAAKGRAKHRKFHGFSCFPLKRLGELLVDWGSFLRKRYGARVGNPLP